MAAGRYGHTVDHDELVELIGDLADAGETLPGGGVSLDTIASNSEFNRSTLAKHCRELANRGDLERQWGIGPNGPQRTYVPEDVTLEVTFR